MKDIYELLKKDHETVKALFEKLEATTEEQSEIREDVFQTLNQELTLHALAEEKFFYPLLKDEEESEDATLEALEEHKVVKKLLKELDANQKNTKEWAAKLKVLQENVEHHVEEEEGELFDKAEDILSDEDAATVAEQVEAFKAEQASLEKTK